MDKNAWTRLAAWAPWILLPIFGSAVAIVFRTSEIDWRSQAPAKRQFLPRSSLALPDGQAIRLIGVPDFTGKTAFWLAERETTWANWVPYDKRHPFSQAAATVSLAEAENYCDWLSRESRRRVRLPTRAEWQMAAHAGLANAPFPWGYNGGQTPCEECGVRSVGCGMNAHLLSSVSRTEGSAERGQTPFFSSGINFASESKPKNAGKAYGWGFRDLAGGVWEWTEEGLAMGGAWSERDPRTLRVDGGLSLPVGYRGADVGFRILVEPE
jgi:formylglycine-generating enzyme required for sulfatase activity